MTTWTGDYCGCCGNQCHGEFCSPCTQHIAPKLGFRHAWERTYFASHGVDCPRQVVLDEVRAT